MLPGCATPTTTPVPPSYHNRKNSDVVRINAQMARLFGPAGSHPEVVVSELRRVLKPGGRFGFFEDKTDIDEVIVGKVFGERSVIRVQYDPEKYNIKGGVVRKV